jgi:hypothetical protein
MSVLKHQQSPVPFSSSSTTVGNAKQATFKYYVKMWYAFSKYLARSCSKHRYVDTGILGTFSNWSCQEDSKEDKLIYYPSKDLLRLVMP